MIDDTALKVATAKILFESMTQEDRDKILQTAIQSLLTEQDSRDIYAKDKRTKFQRLFDDIVAHQAGELVREHLKTPEVREALQQAISAATNQVLSAPSFTEGLAARISAGLWSDR